MCDFVCGTMPRAKVALLMAFNPEKCVVIRTAKKSVLFDYKLRGITLQLIKNAKYLDIQISEQTHQLDDN